ncbi:Uma2 family endonuclease [Streptomonospora sp. S1-112]|uniref:Uma2 family endonuclease n=1 Tax=Streptomonospora mangrovi TaxID=2883123 RepID=A0A9X3SEX5_9ACTN|nr:Uma2 family endonuclease [Streptomonospora mangrovi]MDA0565392.1 Uma2 family endonuclease [Streptomonospora mangrovi]
MIPSKKGMPVTMELCERPQTTVPPKTDLLREIVEARLDVPEGFKVEILGGRIYVSAAPVPRHNFITDLMVERLLGKLAGDRRPSNAGYGIARDVEKGDFAIPDLIVASRAAMNRMEPLIPAGEIDLVGEVVSRNNPYKDLEVLPDLYAEWSIPMYLVVDPRKGEIALYSEPRGTASGGYGRLRRLRFGDVVELVPPLEGLRIETSEFPRYEN